MVEKWQEIEGASMYLISDLGRIKSLKFDKERILKQNVNKYTGYVQCDILYDGNNKRTTKYPHLLVAEAFCENPNKLNRVNHLDLDKLNCKAINLEYVTKLDNIHHYYNSDKPNKCREMRGVEARTLNGTLIGVYPSINQAAKQTGVSAGTVHKAVLGKTKKPRTYIFKYADNV